MNQNLNLPPGPSGRWLPTLRFVRQPRKLLEAWRDQYGDPFLFHALNGPVVVTGREELIREIYGQDPDIYDRFAEQTTVPLLGTGSIFAMAGSPHRRERRLLMPMFHGDRMRAYGTNMCQQAVEQAEAACRTGRVEILPLMTNISFGVIVQNIIGGTSGHDLQRLVQASRRVVESMHPLLFFSRRTHRSFFGLSPWDRFCSARDELYQHIDNIIASRRTAEAQSHDDILSLLCSATYEDGQPMSQQHIRDELMTFIFAGHETTALSLTWAMYHVHHHPEVLNQLQQELRQTGEEPTQLVTAPYLKACIQETLRVHPIITETLRKLRQPMELGQFCVPAGYAVAPATVLAHYNPDVFEQPDQFRPQRFIDRSYSPFTYMPFGGGHRRCVGAAFASYEMAMVLGSLLKHFRFELVETAPVQPVRRNVTMGPGSNVPMRISAL
ncbi:MAG: cytochrome P450 [Pirellulaceae bacterium]|nr:cytochrome P450 [Pirellulaceae bacterium]